jgi:hypothetical protein
MNAKLLNRFARCDARRDSLYGMRRPADCCEQWFKFMHPSKNYVYLDDSLSASHVVASSRQSERQMRSIRQLSSRVAAEPLLQNNTHVTLRSIRPISIKRVF